MLVNSNKIFHGAQHLLTSPFGQKRLNGRVHQGTDYGTYSKKIYQFPPRNFAKVVRVINKETIGNERGIYADLQWPSIDRGLILQHLNAVYVKVGDTINVSDIIGETGDTGLDICGNKVSSGIHAHAELYVISTGKRLNFDTWNMEEDMTEQETREIVKEELDKTNMPVSTWAIGDWDWGIINKLTDGTAPRNSLARQEAIALLHRFYELFVKDIDE